MKEANGPKPAPEYKKNPAICGVFFGSEPYWTRTSDLIDVNDAL